MFVNDGIRSLFDEFLKVIGLFMGVLGGLFVLGVLTKRANQVGAVCGAIIGATVMVLLWTMSSVNGYLYTVSGITACVVSGYVISVLSGGQDRELSGLTIHTVNDRVEE